MSLASSHMSYARRSIWTSSARERKRRSIWTSSARERKRRSQRRAPLRVCLLRYVSVNHVCCSGGQETTAHPGWGAALAGEVAMALLRRPLPTSQRRAPPRVCLLRYVSVNHVCCSGGQETTAHPGQGAASAGEVAMAPPVLAPKKSAACAPTCGVTRASTC